jgi:hypothetical protein
MRILLAMLSCVAMLATGSAASADDSSEEEAVQNVFSAFRQAWDQPGLPGLETLFTKDGCALADATTSAFTMKRAPTQGLLRRPPHDKPVFIEAGANGYPRPPRIFWSAVR